jgi:hypothetical protein
MQGEWKAHTLQFAHVLPLCLFQFGDNDFSNVVSYIDITTEGDEIMLMHGMQVDLH